ncbi:MAG: NYN domain-containing protein [Terracidiphilus sp.]
MMEPSRKRAVTFVDGQNLFHSAKDAFGYIFPNFDIRLLAQTVCAAQGWDFLECRFYTGVPNPEDNAFWNSFWVKKTAQMGRAGVKVYTRPLRYRNKIVRLPDGSSHSFLTGEEKGIDVRIALDILTGAVNGTYDVAVVFSQDQDLSEAATEIRTIAQQQNRWIKVACAFPWSPAAHNKRGINSTDWLKIDRATYDKCIDPKDYRA